MGFLKGNLNYGPSIPSERLELLNHIEDTEYRLTIYDFVYWENMIPETWVKVLNRNIKDWKYVPHTLCRIDKNYMVCSFEKDGQQKELKIRYKEDFHYSWKEFITVLQYNLDS